MIVADPLASFLSSRAESKCEWGSARAASNHFAKKKIGALRAPFFPHFCNGRSNAPLYRSDRHCYVLIRTRLTRGAAGSDRTLVLNIRANPLNLILDALYCTYHKTAHFSDTTTTIAAGGYATRSAHLAMGPRASYAWPQRTRATPPIFLVIPII